MHLVLTELMLEAVANEISLESGGQADNDQLHCNLSEISSNHHESLYYLLQSEQNSEYKML